MRDRVDVAVEGLARNNGDFSFYRFLYEFLFVDTIRQRRPKEQTSLGTGVFYLIRHILVERAKHQSANLPAIRKNLVWLTASGICLGLNWIFLFAAYMHTTIAIASLCNYMAPVIIILIAPVVLHEPLDMRKIPCVIAALIGIVMVSGVWGSSVGNITGMLLGFASALCFVGIVICNRKIHDIPAFDKAAVQLAMSALTILPYVLLKNHGVSLDVDLRSALIILTLGVVHTGIAYCFYFSGLGSLPVQTIAILGYLEPVVSVLCSVVFLRETMSVTGWIGAVLVLGSAVVNETMKTEASRHN
ncbi:MAG: DMT family transporter [Lachnospiraceae bacterium]|nr:DMT family transporter [Lachnospiraceae bacterium]